MAHKRQSVSVSNGQVTPQQKFMQLFTRSSKRPRTLDATEEHPDSQSVHACPRTAMQSVARGKSTDSATAAAKQVGNPTTLVYWNVNGLKGRIENNSRAIKNFLEANLVDVLFLSEVRAKASTHSQAKITDGAKLNSAEAKEKRLIESALAPGGCFEGYRAWFSLAHKKYAGTAMLVRRGTPMPLSVMHSLPSLTYAPGAVDAVSAVELPKETPVKKAHDPEGRIILAEWADMHVLHTYTPNNGSKPENYLRRRVWDARLTTWFEHRSVLQRKYLEQLRDGLSVQPNSNSHSVKDIMYVGDLNVAPTDDDLSHPAFFKAQMPTTDGDARNSGQAGCTRAEQERFAAMLQRGNLVDAFRHTQNRSNTVVGDGPGGDGKDETVGHGGTGSSSSGDTTGKSNAVPSVTMGDDPAQPLYTWRGRPGVDIAHAGRFYGKGMRIDHCLVSHHQLHDAHDTTASTRAAMPMTHVLAAGSTFAETSGPGVNSHCSIPLLDAVQNVRIHGRGMSCNDASFMGSDHCPVSVVLDPHWSAHGQAVHSSEL